MTGAATRAATRRDIRRILGPGGAASAILAGYEARPGQLAMAERIADAIEGNERLLVEAGTGTGKTLAYLVPALLSGRKVVVSTGTKTLQDQIATVDLPRLRRIFEHANLPGSPVVAWTERGFAARSPSRRGTGTLPGSPVVAWTERGFAARSPSRGGPGTLSGSPVVVEWAVMKGLGNYVCRRRLAERDRQGTLVADPDFDRLRAFAESSATGDRADLSDLADEAPLWNEVAATPETRIGPRCTFFESCFVTAMRRRAADAQLVIVNHHLFFADLALRARWPEAQVLPPYEVVIFDEAHQIEEVATEFFGVHASTQRLFMLGRDLARESGVAVRRAESVAARLTAAAAGLADALRELVPAPRPGTDETRAPFPADLVSGPARAAYHRLDDLLDETASWLDPDGAAVAESRRPAEVAALGRRAAALRTDLAVLIDGRGREHVRWLGVSARNVALHASPVDVAPLLGQALDACPGAIVLTSATLTVAGSFEYLRARVGLRDTAAEASFPSPFSYARQALLYVAPDLPEPNQDDFALAAAARMAALCAITGGRALLLFTSFKNLRIAEAHLRVALPFPLLVQGQRPRHLLLAALRTHIGSVLLATQSFWEGVDVPGEALSLVVMDRIPFAVPDDPLTAARIDRIREDGGDPFRSFQLPRAALALKQGFGRLVRSRGDHGIVGILDGRVARRSYGATLRASLPLDCPRTESLEEVSAFWTRVHPPAPLFATATPPP